MINPTTYRRLALPFVVGVAGLLLTMLDTAER